MSRLLSTLILLIVILLAACDTGEQQLQDVIAQRFLGSAPGNVTGPDADNDGAVDAATDMVTGRRFDLTPTGFTIASGDVSSEAPAGSDFGVADGTLEVDGDQATVDLAMFSSNPDVDNAQMVGTFSLSEASQALVNPGDSFLVDWDISFDYLGFPVQLAMQQELTGSDFVDQE